MFSSQQYETTKAPFTRYNRLSNPFDNRFDKRLYRVQPVVKPVVQPGWITG